MIPVPYSLNVGKLKTRQRYYQKRSLELLVVSRVRCSPRSSPRGYVFLERFSTFHTPSGKLLDARDELCSARKEGQSTPGAPQG